jgi:hypothetical protein
MEPDAQEHFDQINFKLTEHDLKLEEHDEKFIAQDKSLSAIRTLLMTGARMLIAMDKKFDALADSEARLYGSMQELAEAQKRTDEALHRFLERSGNGHNS